jgi:hypothetical protein
VSGHVERALLADLGPHELADRPFHRAPPFGQGLDEVESITSMRTCSWSSSTERLKPVPAWRTAFDASSLTMTSTASR